MFNLFAALCFLYDLPGPPKLNFQNGTFQLYTVNRKICPIFDPLRDSTFELYTRKNPTSPDYLKLNEEVTITGSRINFSSQTVIFFHGFLESSESDDSVLMRDNYLKYCDCNVIIVNNQRLLAGPDYITSAVNIEPIGKYVAKLVDQLVSSGLQLPKVHIIGMSLGAHIAGVVGRSITSGKVPRITGLDPAGPIAGWSSTRLNKNDADFVDVIHSNAGVFGVDFPCGHIDIWLNDGTSQPACSFSEIAKRAPGDLLELVFCNHYQSYRSYVASLIDPTVYQAVQCNSYEQYYSGKCDGNEKTFLGVEIDQTARGNYYVKTSSEPVPSSKE